MCGQGWAESPAATPQHLQEQLTFQLNQCQYQKKNLDIQLDSLKKAHQKSLVLLGQKPFHPRFLKGFPNQSTSLTMPIPKKKLKYLQSASSWTQSKSLYKQIEGKTTLFAFWATWCTPCVSPEEQAHLRTLAKKLKNYNIPLVSIGIDSWKKIKKQKSKWYYPLWYFKDAHFDWVPEIILKKVGMGLPLFILRTSSGQVKWILTETLRDESVEEWLIAAVRSKVLD